MPEGKAAPTAGGDITSVVPMADQDLAKQVGSVSLQESAPQQQQHQQQQHSAAGPTPPGQAATAATAAEPAGAEDEEEEEEELPSAASQPRFDLGRIREIMDSTHQLSVEERFYLCRSVGCECVQDGELRRLLESSKPEIVAYDGFEPSGRMHIAQGILKALNVNKLTRSGVTFRFWVADWFAQLNNKMGGDLKKIQTVGEYMVEVWKAAGMRDIGTKVQFLFSSAEINARAAEYWPLVMEVARLNSLKRVVRCGQVMGRSEAEELSAAQIFYPCMQCADIFFLKADICQLGLDQRKVNMLAREFCDASRRRFKPIILSHAMLPGLQKGQEKMSKSQPNSAIFMEDSSDEVRSKIRQAWCPERETADNPCIAYATQIVLPWSGRLAVRHRDGRETTYTDEEGLVGDYASGALHPSDLKPALTAALNEILEPVRKHFRENKAAKALLEKVKKYKTTR